MTKNELIRLVQTRKKELSKPYEIDPGYEMCKHFVEGNNIIKIEDFAKADIWEFLRCKAYLCLDGIEVEDSILLVDTIQNVFKNTDYDVISNIMSVFLSAKEDKMLENIIKYLKESSIIKEKMYLKKVYPADKLARESFIKIKSLNDEDKKRDIIKLLEYINEYDEDQLSLIVEFYEIFLAINFTLSENEKFLSSIDFNVRKRDIKKALNGIFKDHFNVGKILSEAKEVNSFVLQCESNKRQYERDTEGEIAGLDKALSMLEVALEKEEITNAREIVKNIKSLEIKYAFLEFIYEYNKSYYQSLDNELNSLNQNTEANYQALLNDYNISYNQDFVKNIMHNSLDDVKGMLTILKRFNLENEVVLKVLSNSSFEIVSMIKDYLDKGFLTFDIIYSNIDLFYIQKDKLQLLNNSIGILQKYNINPAIFKESFYILVMGSESNLEKNLDVLDRYNLLRFIRTSSDYGFMNDELLENKIDKFLELGYEDYLVENLSFLNSQNIKRLEVLKAMGMPITSLEDLKEVLNNSSFFIKDEELDFYIPNVVPYKEPIKVDDSFSIDSFRKSIRTYSFNGVLVSIPKVERLLESGLSMTDAILSNTNLSEEEYEALISAINPYSYK